MTSLLVIDWTMRYPAICLTLQALCDLSWSTVIACTSYRCRAIGDTVKKISYEGSLATNVQNFQGRSSM